MMVAPEGRSETGVRDGMSRLDRPAEGAPAPTANMPPNAFPRRRRLYLAHPFGYAESDRYALDRIRAELESLGASVREPGAECEGLGPRAAMKRRLSCISDCDGLFAVVNGSPPDPNVMVEVGYAFSQDKAVFLFRDDYRTCSDADGFPLNQMAFAGLPDDWKVYWYGGVADLGDTKKALVRWLDRGK